MSFMVQCSGEALQEVLAGVAPEGAGEGGAGAMESTLHSAESRAMGVRQRACGQPVEVPFLEERRLVGR
jgi:hypothetical protein